jgi:hypothetical protein
MTTATYSCGRCSVYPISDRAISKINAPALSFLADRTTARAVSYAIARTLIAGTVNPSASP